MAPDPNKNVIGVANQENLSSVTETDTNGELANVVDGLFAIPRAIDDLAPHLAMCSYERGLRSICSGA